MSTSGRTASTCKRAWSRRRNACCGSIGATPEGKKELLGFQVGVRESAQSWRELLIDLKARGLAIAPELATGDGALGFWTAIEQVWPATRCQRCTVHKTVNVMDKMPKSVQPAAIASSAIRLRSSRRLRRRRGRLARDLGSARSRHGRDRDGHVRRHVWRQVRQGGRLPHQGPRRAADVLRPPGRALGPPAHVQPDPERVRNRPAPHGALPAARCRRTRPG